MAISHWEGVVLKILHTDISASFRYIDIILQVFTGKVAHINFSVTYRYTL